MPTRRDLGRTGATALGGTRIAQPQGVGAQCFHECAMGSFYVLAEPGRKSRWALPGFGGASTKTHVSAALAVEAERGLAFAQQFDVDAGEQQGIQQRTMLGALREIDAVALAERIQTIWAGRVTAPRQHQRIDDAIGSERRSRCTLQLGVDEPRSKVALWATSGASSMKLEELLGHIPEERLVLQEVDCKAVNGHSVWMDVALRVEVAMEFTPGGNAVDDLDTAKLDQAITAGGIESRSFPCRTRSRAAFCESRAGTRALAERGMDSRLRGNGVNARTFRRPYRRDLEVI